MKYDVIRQEEMIHALFGGSQTEVIKHNCYNITLMDSNKQYTCNFEAYSQQVICGDVISIKNGSWIPELQHLGIEISDRNDGPIELLIGADIAGKLFTGEKHQLSSGLVALETSLGWTLMGKIHTNSRNYNACTSIVTSMYSNDISISNLWSLDVLGITDPATEKSQEENSGKVRNFFRETVRIAPDGRYQVSLPWIDHHPPLPNNFEIAKKRLHNLNKKLNKDGYYQEYDMVFREWIQEGIIERVEENISIAGKSSYNYLPHSHVVKLSSATTKIRPVFDASVKISSEITSLNQCLEKGVNLIELIPYLLIDFRMFRIGVTADIRKAFLQISLNEDDRDYLRFLWYDKNNEIQIYRHTRVVFGVTSSPFLLAAVIEHHLQRILDTQSKYSPKNIIKLLKSFYVDNCVTSVDDTIDLSEFIKDSTEVMKEAQFDLRLWEHSILEDEIKEQFITNILGLRWNRTEYTLKISMEGMKNLSIEKITKRVILSISSRIFDPIGFAQPVLLCPKLILQKTWQINLGWNSEVPAEIRKTFLVWLQEITILEELSIPRWLVKVPAEDILSWSIHMFCDASQDAYAAVLFLRVESSSEAKVSLVQAKNRISPIKKISIPRLELLAATIGVRLLNSVLKQFSCRKMCLYCWTDSSTVLTWIKQNEVWKPFVWNRIQEIRKYTDAEIWNHVPGNKNPADLLSRGCTAKFLIKSKWWEGPDWLYLCREEKKPLSIREH